MKKLNWTIAVVLAGQLIIGMAHSSADQSQHIVTGPTLNVSPPLTLSLSKDYVASGVSKGPNNSILVFGTGASKNTPCSPTGTAAVYKFDSRGQIDTSFADHGVFSLDASGSTYSDIWAVVNDSENNYYVSGYSVNASAPFNCAAPDYQYFLIKLNSAGRQDTKFGGAGSLRNLMNIPVFYRNEMYIFQNRQILAFKLNGQPFHEFGNNGVANLTESKIDSGVLSFGEKFIYAAGTVSNPCIQLATCGPSDWWGRTAVTSINFRGVEQKTFQGDNNYIYSQGFKDGPLSAPLILGNNLYVAATVLTSKQPPYVRDTLFTSFNLNGQPNSGFGSAGKAWLSSLSPNSTAVTSVQRVSTSQMLLVSNELDGSHRFLLLNSDQNSGSSLSSIGALPNAFSGINLNSDGTYFAYTLTGPGGTVPTVVTIQKVGVNK